ncbi:MAG: hypothetical protein ABWZ66_10945, partial [Pyrinomonadaceae bacterium]
RVVRLLAVFFVLYAVADVTVLQEYCGNEMLGIPSFAQQVHAEKQQAETVSKIRVTSKISDFSPQEQTPDLPDSEEDCFCCCSHTLLGFNSMKSYTPILVLKNSDSNFSLKIRQSSTHLRLVYQPPKLA